MFDDGDVANITVLTIGISKWNITWQTQMSGLNRTIKHHSVVVIGNAGTLGMPLDQRD